MTRLFLVLLISISAKTLWSQGIVTIVPKQSSTHYFQNNSGTITFPVEIMVNYNGDSVTRDYPLIFTTTRSTNSTLIPDRQTLGTDISSIPAAEFGRTIKSKKVIVQVSMNAVPVLTNSQLFDIVLTGADSTEPYHRVLIDNTPMGQDEAPVQIIHIPQDTAELAPLENDEASSEERRMLFVYKVVGKLQRDTTIKLALKSNSGSAVKPVLMTTEFTIPRSKTVNGSYQDTVEVFFDINSVKSFGRDEVISLKMENENTRDYAVFSRSGLYHPNKPFWIEAGANFDLLDGLEANNVFGGIFLYKRDIKSFLSRSYNKTWRDSTVYVRKNGRVESIPKAFKIKTKIPKKERQFNFSILAGIYESRSLSNQSNDTSMITYIDGRSLAPDTANTYAVFKDTGSITQNTSITNLGLFFSPQIRITHGSANTDGFHVFGSLWFEIIWQRSHTKVDYSKTTNFETLRVKKEELTAYQHKLVETRQDYRTQYVGMGLPMYLKDGNVNLFLQPCYWLYQSKI